MRFLVMGDTGQGDAGQYDTAREMAALRQQFPFEFVIMVGDNIYGSDTPGGLRQEVRDSLQAASRRRSEVLRHPRQS